MQGLLQRDEHRLNSIRRRKCDGLALSVADSNLHRQHSALSQGVATVASTPVIRPPPSAVTVLEQSFCMILFGVSAITMSPCPVAVTCTAPPEISAPSSTSATWLRSRKSSNISAFYTRCICPHSSFAVAGYRRCRTCLQVPLQSVCPIPALLPLPGQFLSCRR